METNIMTKEQLIESVIASTKRLRKYDAKFYQIVLQGTEPPGVDKIRRGVETPIENGGMVEVLDGRGIHKLLKQLQ